MTLINKSLFQKGCKNNFFLIDLLHSAENRYNLFDFQLILKNKKYYFNPNTLQYEIKTIPFRVFIGKILRFMGITSAASIVLSIFFFIFLGSPIERVLQYRINSINSEYTALNNTIINLQSELQEQIFPGDKFYRQLLELDSLSTLERLAGIGGSEAEIELKNYASNLVINSTSQHLKSLKKQIELQDKSYQAILKEAMIYSSELVDIPAIQPIKPTKNIWISSYYGRRTDPFTKKTRNHKGIDFVGPKNTEIFATADGKVKFTKVSRRGYGKEIIILHKFGYNTRYAHLNEILVEEGQDVKRGELIGLMGNTGRSTGTHLHYEVKLNNRQINPYYFFSDDLTAKEYELITSLSATDKNE